ncbi:FixH family protein [Ferruginibacter sp.]|nr:FixH family protein [Ferruginibacter sp.]
MNWGYKILVVYGVFVAGIMFMVFKSSSQKMDLVTTDYYAKELKYQDDINATENANALSENVRYEIKGNQVLLHFPKDLSGKTIAGNAVLYCPSDENKDIKQDFSLQDAPLVLQLTARSKGQFELHITWQAGGVSYYFEQKIFI